jgi:hypothetical protein
MSRHWIRCASLALFGALAASCRSTQTTRTLVEDPAFERLPTGADRRSEKLDPALNITRVEVWSRGGELAVTLETEAASGPQSGFGLHFDADRDGEGEAWVFLGPDGARLSDNHLAVLAHASVEAGLAGRSLSARFTGAPVRDALPALNRGLTPAVVAVSMDLGRPIGDLPLLGQPTELVGLNLGPGATILFDVDPGKAGQGALATSKHIPVENREKGADANGDERPDWPFPDNTRSMSNAQGQPHCKFEVWALDLGQPGADAEDRIAYKVSHPDGTAGWVAQCPYEGGDNFVLWLDSNDDDAVDSMLYVSMDTGVDDDHDGKKDAMAYAYTCPTKKHVGEHLQDARKVAGHLREHDGPHPKFTDLEWWP